MIGVASARVIEMNFHFCYPKLEACWDMKNAPLFLLSTVLVQQIVLNVQRASWHFENVSLLINHGTHFIRKVHKFYSAEVGTLLRCHADLWKRFLFANCR